MPAVCLIQSTFGAMRKLVLGSFVPEKYKENDCFRLLYTRLAMQYNDELTSSANTTSNDNRWQEVSVICWIFINDWSARITLAK